MSRVTNLLLLVIIVRATSFFAGDALQPRQQHDGGCVAAERAALVSFKKGITNDSTNLLGSWRGQDCCRWRGVECSNRTGFHVVKLQLRNTNLNTGMYRYSCGLLGEISPSLLSLEHLEHIDLSMNCLQGPNNGSIPNFLGSLKNLRYLNLSGIRFTGRVPSQLGNLSKLQYLDLSQSRMMSSSDITWLTKLPLLQYLDMSSVNLSGIAEWPHTLNMIPSLREISLYDCSLDGANQSLLQFNLMKLEKLDLSFNTFEHSVASSWFWKAISLRYLNLKATRLFGQLPNALGSMTSLQVLDLSNSLITGSMIAVSWMDLCSLEILDLSFNLINGSIAVLIEGLAQCPWNRLQKLDVSFNEFTGTLPNSIGNFTRLNILSLSNNILTGSIPPEIGYLKCLTELDLSGNHFSGSVPSEIGALANLTSLLLSNNNFSGSVPSEIGSFTYLTSLVLRNNSFSGVITEEHFASLKSLINIDLSSNAFTIVIDSDWRPPFRLEYAVFANCQMGPLFPVWLQWLLEIIILDISNTGLKHTIPDWFWSTFSQAGYIDISKNKISGSLPAHLDGMALEEFYLGSNQITGPIPVLPRNITMLDISNNAFSGTLPSYLEAPRLRTLIAYSNKISGSIPASMCKLQQLDDLDLSSNILEGEIPRCLKTENISFLLLGNNSLSGQLPAVLKNSTSLQLLDLAWNKFSGRLPAWIGELGNLRFLRLSHNGFSGPIPVEITNLRYLQILDLSDNNISGAIPRHLSNLTCMTLKGFIPIYRTEWGPPSKGAKFVEILAIILKGQQLRYGSNLAYFLSIDLSKNFLTGEIPTDISSLDALINLNLSSNHLTGSIPIKIGTMQLLESVDLSENKLYGEIPSSLSSLTSLSYLNLSYNNLSGRIPSGRQLDTLNADNPSLIYIGNNGLCGPPLQKNCPGNNTDIHGHLGPSKREFEPMTFHFGLVLGLVAGHWMVFCVLMFKKTWRFAYFQLFDKLHDRIYVFVVVNWANLSKNTTTDLSCNR